MKVTDFCKSYFNGFQNISNYKKNDAKTNALTAVKILSYFTVVIPLGFAVLYRAASLCGRVSKKGGLSSHDKRANDKAKKILLKTVESFNYQLAKKIIAASGEEDENHETACSGDVLVDTPNYVKNICSGNFLVDPTGHLVHEMIKRGWTDDGARAFVIGRIPGFIEKVSSPDYLRAFAEHYFENHYNKTEILQFFERSLSNVEFQKDLESAVEKFNSGHGDASFYDAEHPLRIALSIYDQSERLQEYTREPIPE